MLGTDRLLKDHPAHARVVSYWCLELHTCDVGIRWTAFKSGLTEVSVDRKSQL